MSDAAAFALDADSEASPADGMPTRGDGSEPEPDDASTGPIDGGADETPAESDAALSADFREDDARAGDEEGAPDAPTACLQPLDCLTDGSVCCPGFACIIGDGGAYCGASCTRNADCNSSVPGCCASIGGNPMTCVDLRFCQ